MALDIHSDKFASYDEKKRRSKNDREENRSRYHEVRKKHSEDAISSSVESLSLSIENGERKASTPTTAKGGQDLPDYFDWRNELGGRITTIKDQGTFNACSAFAIVAAIESMILKERLGNRVLGYSQQMSTLRYLGMDQYLKDGELDLSEASLFFGSGGFKTNAIGISDAIDHAHHKGINGEKVLPFDFVAAASPNLKIMEKKPAIQIYQGRRIDYLDLSDIKRHIVQNGPVVATIIAYSDIAEYPISGTDNEVPYHPCVIPPVNENLLDDFPIVQSPNPGGKQHSICIVGYDDRTMSDGTNRNWWIIKNSYGNQWGYDGYGYIEYDGPCCGMESGFWSITMLSSVTKR